MEGSRRSKRSTRREKTEEIASGTETKESWELKGNYIKNIDERAEAQFQEGFNESADDWAPHHALEDALGDAFAALTTETETEEESNKNQESKKNPHRDEDTRVIKEPHWVIA